MCVCTCWHFFHDWMWHTKFFCLEKCWKCIFHVFSFTLQWLIKCWLDSSFIYFHDDFCSLAPLIFLPFVCLSCGCVWMCVNLCDKNKDREHKSFDEKKLYNVSFLPFYVDETMKSWDDSFMLKLFFIYVSFQCCHQMMLFYVYVWK